MTSHTDNAAPDLRKALITVLTTAAGLHAEGGITGWYVFEKACEDAYKALRDDSPAPAEAPELTFDEIENAFPNGHPYSVHGRDVIVNAQWLHEFARAIERALLRRQPSKEQPKAVGAADGFGPTKNGCCGVTVTERCSGCPYDTPQPVAGQSAPVEGQPWITSNEPRDQWGYCQECNCMFNGIAPCDKRKAAKKAQQVAAVSADVHNGTELRPTSDYHEDYGDCLFFHFNSFEEPPEVYCGSPLEVQPEFDEEYWTHFVRFDFNKVIRAAVATSTEKDQSNG